MSDDAAETKPPWPWEYCAVCLWDFPWLHQVGDPSKPAHIAFGPGGAVEVTSKIQASAHGLLGSSHLRVEQVHSAERRADRQGDAVGIVARSGVEAGHSPK